MGKNTFKLQVAGITKTTSIEVFEDLKFTVQFERKDNYKGEFGFDWMRDDYGTGVSLNYEDLKKEYKETQINDQEYFVPYLSMLPDQDKVILNLKLDILEGKARKDDVIKFPAKGGIKFEPEEVSLKDLEKEQEELEKEEAKGYEGDVSKITRTEVKVICENPLNQDTSIELLDKNDELVGEIIVVKNDKMYDLDIKFVKVNIGNPRSLNHLKEKFNRNINQIEEHLVNGSLNQAFIKPRIINKDFDSLEFINLDELSDEMFGVNRININKKGREALKEKYQTDNNFKGLVIFYVGMENTKSKAGDTQTIPLDEQFVYLYLNSVLTSDVSHEVGHALGLEHLFIESSDYVTKLNKNKKFYEDQLKKNEEYRGDSKYRQDGVLSNITKLNNRIAKINQRIKDYNTVSQNNKHKFVMSETTNLMDYNNKGKDFYHWQWKIMQKEIIKYYN
ncbi:hypothetical protein [uncultured Aquimarina sp.]|uniref:hypothetical protein n=1 Tax=uncultured Aquimarina sp. TaxID=575652 RepID=UPI002629BB97|nr:hypothetical protein [uncultured Aquimarina sp.]